VATAVQIAAKDSEWWEYTLLDVLTPVYADDVKTEEDARRFVKALRDHADAEEYGLDHHGFERFC